MAFADCDVIFPATYRTESVRVSVCVSSFNALFTNMQIILTDVKMCQYSSDINSVSLFTGNLMNVNS